MTRQIFQPPEGEDDAHAYHTQLEKIIASAMPSFENFVQTQIIASSLLLIATLVALVWASHPYWQSTYTHFTQFSLGIHFGEQVLSKTLQFWTNDVLLTLFFLLVGLEIKREILVGELVDRQKAVTIIFAAIGGMLVPALIYIAFNINQPTLHGWGIPIATDTAFALGLLACFRKHLPKGIFTFLAAMAIIDDIGAISVIGIFYSHDVNIYALTAALFLTFILILLNFAGVRKALPYLLLGLGVWILTEFAEIHGTVAGIIVAFTIPARPRKGPKHFLKKSRELLKRFEKRKQENPLILEDQKQHKIIEQFNENAKQATTPLQRWESTLAIPTAFFILPFFALLNAGIPINFTLFDNVFYNSASLGILVGMLFGKPLGIFVFSLVCLKCKIGTLPENLNLKHIGIIGILGGIGFTMSIFISQLVFEEPQLILVSKTAILLSSFLAAIMGGISLSWLIYSNKENKTPTEKPVKGL